MPSSDNDNSSDSGNNQARPGGISGTTMIFANDLQGIKPPVLIGIAVTYLISSIHLKGIAS